MNVLPLFRSIVVAIIYPWVTSSFAILVVFLGFFQRARACQDQVIACWARVSLKLFGVRVQASGLERLPLGGYIAVFNHTSNFDILAVQSLIPRIRFGAKIELFRIPIFGHAMKAARALPIARTRRTEVLRVYDQAKQRLLEGECFILAPEGTRQEEEKLGPFKSGPFLFAINAQVPIVPIAIKGASKIQPKRAWLPNSHHCQSSIEVLVGDPIQTIGLNSDDKDQLQRKVLEDFHQLGLS